MAGHARAVRTGQRFPMRRAVLWGALACFFLLVAVTLWVGVRGLMAKNELEESVRLVTTMREQIVEGDPSAARSTAGELVDHASAARSLTDDLIWRAAEPLPFVGADLRAVRQVSAVVDDVASGAVEPAVGVLEDVDPKAFAPEGGRVDLQPLIAARPAVRGATEALAKAEHDASDIDVSSTVSPVTNAVVRLKNTLGTAADQAVVAERVVSLAPSMLGADGPRRYLLLVQNNAELRAGGGIPGAVALLEVDHGTVRLEEQASGSSFGEFESPVLPIDGDTEGLYGDITGRYMQDVTLTPRFALSAELAREMWRKRFGQQVDGVVAIDPVTLGYVLRATGPVRLPSGEELTSDNAVPLLMSEVYAKYENGDVQDAFFASAASAVFDKVASGAFDPEALVRSLVQGTQEGRLRLWSAKADEQRRLSGTELAGELPVSSSQVRQIGVYLNDATGAKMDYYLEKTISLGTSVCRKDGRPTSVVDVTLQNSAPSDAASRLPEYVTGGANFGVAPGKIATLVAVYAPEGSIYLGATQDGRQVGVQTTMDGDHPVAQLSTLLAPGQSTTLRVAFLGDAAHGKVGVEALSTPGIRQTAARPLTFDCTDPTAS